MTWKVCLAAVILALASVAEAAPPRDPLPPPEQARWIWPAAEGKGAAALPGTAWFRAEVVLPAGPQVRGTLWVTSVGDNAEVYINGTRVTNVPRWDEMKGYTAALVPGRNLIAIRTHTAGVGAGLVCWLRVQPEGGSKGGSICLVSDKRWKASADFHRGWEKSGFDDSAWAAAKELGPVDQRPGEGQPITADAARALLEDDWLFQADDAPTPERTLLEIGWARELAARLSANKSAPAFTKELAELAALEEKTRALAGKPDQRSVRELYLTVRRAKRQIALGNPLLDFDRILLVDMATYQGGRGGIHESTHRLGDQYGPDAVGRLIVLEGLRPDGKTFDLIPPETGYVMRMDLSFDARKVLYSYKPREEKWFHLYEVGIDGGGRRQLTDATSHDMDPIYLPDGHLMFCTTRGQSLVRCAVELSTVLARADAEGKNIYMVSRNSEPDYTPCLLSDGRVLYTRWEYTERPLWDLQKLWTINPDGTGEAMYWGNSSTRPNMPWEARPVPGTDRVIFSGVGHHNVWSGSLGMMEVSKGLEWPWGLYKVTAEVPYGEGGDGDKRYVVNASPNYHSAGAFHSYRCPYPLGPEDFLASAARGQHGRFRLYLMDIHGNRELLYAGRRNAWYAQPVRPRQRPPIIPDRVAWPKPGEAAQPGVLFSPNVYQGLEGVAPGKAKFLRVIQQDYKTYSGGPTGHFSQPAISMVQSDSVKRILGTVPIQPDGSVSLKVPAGVAVYFQLLDERQRCLQVMRSFTGVMPGEVRGCQGCHAAHSTSPQPSGGFSMAMRQPAAELTPPPWGAGVSVGFERFVQPVLDKHCGKCHQGNGEGRKKLDLTLREYPPTGSYPISFKEPYVTLVGATGWGHPRNLDKNAPGCGIAGAIYVEGGPRKEYGPLKPMTRLSYTSPLIDRVTSGSHHGVKIGGEDLQKLLAWVDCNCVYYGDEEVRAFPDKGCRDAPRIDRLQPITDPPAAKKP